MGIRRSCPPWRTYNTWSLVGRDSGARFQRKLRFSSFMIVPVNHFKPRLLDIHLLLSHSVVSEQEFFPVELWQ